jgi:hypothetical protein
VADHTGQGSNLSGMAREELIPGVYVTVSGNKRTPDRSLVNSIWRVLAVNEAHAVLKIHSGMRSLDGALDTVVVPIQEYDFYLADHLAAAMESCKGPSASIVEIRERCRSREGS